MYTNNPTNRNSCENWHIQLKLIPYWGFWGSDCGLGMSPKWPGSRQKKFDQKFWSMQFLSYTKVYTSKESWEQFSFRFEIKLEDFVMKKLKKIDFVIFDPKKSWSRLGLGWISGTPVKIVKKWLDYLVLGMFFDKVKKFCDHSITLC